MQARTTSEIIDREFRRQEDIAAKSTREETFDTARDGILPERAAKLASSTSRSQPRANPTATRDIPVEAASAHRDGRGAAGRSRRQLEPHVVKAPLPAS